MSVTQWAELHLGLTRNLEGLSPKHAWLHSCPNSQNYDYWITEMVLYHTSMLQSNIAEDLKRPSQVARGKGCKHLESYVVKAGGHFV